MPGSYRQTTVKISILGFARKCRKCGVALRNVFFQTATIAYFLRLLKNVTRVSELTFNELSPQPFQFGRTTNICRLPAVLPSGGSRRNVSTTGLLESLRKFLWSGPPKNIAVCVKLGLSLLISGGNREATCDPARTARVLLPSGGWDCRKGCGLMGKAIFGRLAKGNSHLVIDSVWRLVAGKRTGTASGQEGKKFDAIQWMKVSIIILLVTH